MFAGSTLTCHIDGGGPDTGRPGYGHAALSVAGTDCRARDVYLLQPVLELNRGAVVQRDRVHIGVSG
jgi:hypothetical protein